MNDPVDPARPPSLEVIEAGDLRMELMPEAGGRVHRLTHRGRDVLRTPADPRSHLVEPLFWGSYPLIPWSNRIPDGQLRFRGVTHPQPVNYGTFAIHGEGFAAPWGSGRPGEMRLHGGGGAFPWRYTATQRLALEGSVVIWELWIRNDGTGEMPAGLGFHPWFPVTADATITLPAASVHPSRDEIPCGEAVPVTGEFDLRAPTRIPFGINECWTDLSGEPAVLTLPGQGLRVQMRANSVATHAVFAAVQPLHAVALELVTHATDGHGRLERGEGGGIGVLAPGAEMHLRYELRITPL
ncbi:MAG: aldose epimerase family protein [Candidatus Dormibacteria bacterium]